MQLPRTLFLSTRSGFLAENFLNDLYYFLLKIGRSSEAVLVPLTDYTPRIINKVRPSHSYTVSSSGGPRFCSTLKKMQGKWKSPKWLRTFFQDTALCCPRNSLKTVFITGKSWKQHLVLHRCNCMHHPWEHTTKQGSISCTEEYQE